MDARRLGTRVRRSLIALAMVMAAVIAATATAVISAPSALSGGSGGTGASGSAAEPAAARLGGQHPVRAGVTAPTTPADLPPADLPPADLPPAEPAPPELLFGPYKDISMSLSHADLVLRTAAPTGAPVPLVGPGGLADYLPGVGAITLSFATGECGREQWVGVPGQALADANIAALADAGQPYIISTGGAGGVFTCADPAQFAVFLDRYLSPQLLGVDFDIEEGQSPAQIADLVAAAAYGESLHPELRFSFTLATLAASDGSAAGLNRTGDAVVRAIQDSSLTNYTINLMVGNYGRASSRVCVVADGRCDMGQSAVQAVANLRQSYGVAAANIELTPMIGMNDVTSEVVTIADAAFIADYALRAGLAGLHYWSLDRDTPCGAMGASPLCSSVSEGEPLGYARAFLAGLRR